ncbi:MULTISPECIES: DUF4150 domain-containing protein [Achromobacter]|jgi:hypothetical protein|uniref:DUF4150 domain-containing protein n=1 Tax=Achromobacter spanius TaxID=217203 RepID=A0A3Q9KPJ4_9BURK|nr:MULTISPECIES: DUF4150 domain-containing protein [Achromobacter]AZS81966.1 DUF4150 domain-containing protein [Achromobacter spanius]KNE28680.1 type VI secretion protein [Achromobacter spanius]MCD0500123.1 DUF4150 domain-containing protein [Achromobacter sp. MY14]MCW3154013.1 DUF4150 domain-containing protein [Achromobacter spanius]MDH0735503.1 DUF4150 domain-containing protein [Achromobacter spanius]
MFMLNNAGAMTTATVPDVCLTPAVPSPIPMPYPNIAMSDMADPGGIVENVLVGGMPALNQASTIMLSNGDQAGAAGGGVACGEIMGEAAFVTGSMKVMVGGPPGVRLTCMTTQNANNTVGIVAAPSQVIVMLVS